MTLDPAHCLLQLLVQCHRPGAEDQLVQPLPLLGSDDEARVDIFVDERVVEHDHIRESPVPRVVLKHRRRRAAVAIEDGVRRMHGREATPLSDRDRVTCCQGAQNGRKRRLAPAVLGVDQREGRERNVRAIGHGIERPDVSE